MYKKVEREMAVRYSLRRVLAAGKRLSEREEVLLAVLLVLVMAGGSH